MYNFLIRDMAYMIANRLMMSDHKREEIEKIIAEFWEDRIADTWTIEDVYGQADEMGIKLTDDEARDILNLTLDKFNANVGINWSVIASHIQDYKGA